MKKKGIEEASVDPEPRESRTETLFHFADCQYRMWLVLPYSRPGVEVYAPIAGACGNKSQFTGPKLSTGRIELGEVIWCASERTWLSIR